MVNNTIKPIVLVAYFFWSLLALHASEVKRDLVVLWSSTETLGKEYTYGTVHRNMESVFNYLGYRLKYVEVNYELSAWSKKNQIKNYAGVLTFFFDNKIKEVKNYIDFLSSVIENNIPLLVMGEWGFVNENLRKNKAEIDQLLKRLSLKAEFTEYDNPLLFKVLKKLDHVEFERKIKNELLRVVTINNTGPSSRVHLSIEVKGEEKPADVIILDDRKFFYAQRGFEIFENPYNKVSNWRIDPFYYFGKVLGNENPIPDVTTLNGNRIAFFHIDGDGFINTSEIDRTKTSGEIIISEILKRYSLPTTASVVTSEIDSNFFGTKKSENLAREMFRNPFIEVASHTFAHPLSWSMVPDEQDIKAYVDDRNIKKHKGPILAYKVSGYQMDYYKEVVESVEYVNQNLLSKNKKTQVLQWSGNCRPPEIAIELVEKQGLAQLNGGDSRFDKTFNSYTGLSALYRQVGQYLQVYSGAANENIYTNLWQGPFNGFINVIDNFKNTDSPYRIKPINIYYHFYSGEKVSSLAALKSIYDWVLTQEINPLFASEYVQVVKGFESARIDKIKKNHFRITNNGLLRTIRFDKTILTPDYNLSKNVVGHFVKNNSLYVSLGDLDQTDIVLSNQNTSNVYISHSNSIIDKVLIKNNEMFLRGKANVPLEIKLSNGKIIKGSRGNFRDLKVAL